MYLLFERFLLRREYCAYFFELFPVYRKARLLHIEKHFHERKLYIVVKSMHARFFKLFVKTFFKSEHAARNIFAVYRIRVEQTLQGRVRHSGVGNILRQSHVEKTLCDKLEILI